MINNHNGAGSLLPNPTKCHELTKSRIKYIALSGATGNTPPDNEPNLLREYRIVNIVTTRIPNRNGCFASALIFAKLLLSTNSISSKLSSITPISE